MVNINGYRNSILECMNNYQKDYYKECTYVSVLYSTSSNPILVLFGKTPSEIVNYEMNDTYAYRTTLHYYRSFTINYSLGTDKEQIIKMLLDRLELAFTKLHLERTKK